MAQMRRVKTSAEEGDAGASLRCGHLSGCGAGRESGHGSIVIAVGLFIAGFAWRLASDRIAVQLCVHFLSSWPSPDWLFPRSRSRCITTLAQSLAPSTITGIAAS